MLQNSRKETENQFISREEKVFYLIATVSGAVGILCPALQPWSPCRFFHLSTGFSKRALLHSKPMGT
jgi:hypothetical protein